MSDLQTMTASDQLMDVLTVAQQVMSRLPAHMADHFDLHPSRLAALSCIQAGGTRVTDVATASLVSVSAASRTVDVLVDDGLVERDRDPNNRRAVILTLTADGASLMERITGYFTETFLDAVLADLGEQRVKELADAFLDFTVAIGQRLDQVETDR